MRTMVGTILVATLMGFGCKKQEDAGKPSGVPPLDPATQAAAPAPAPAPSGAPAAPPAAAAPGATISGEIVIAPAMSGRKPSGTLYLVARRPPDNPNARGTLVAVKKLPATTFPLAFTLSAADMPFQNGAFDGDMQLSARIDQDGDPMSRQKGDIFGVLPKVPVGSHDVKVSLDQLQKETESLAGGGAMPAGPHPGTPPGHP